MLGIGVIGYGYWGPNIVRNFSALEGVRVVGISDKNTDIISRLAAANPSIRTCTNPMELIEAPDVDALAIVTPVSTHYELARKALENGKHVFVEKPLTASSAQAEDLIELAETKKLKIMVDHTFLFTGAVRKIKQLIDTKELGKIFYYDSVRVNLGLFQHDVNVVWDLAPHDFSIMSYLIDEPPVALSAWGKSHVNSLEDIAYVTAHFNTSIVAHFSVNWLSPVKVRTTLIGGEKKMLVWNDLKADEKLKIYDKGVEARSKQGIYDILVSYRAGDMWAPKVEGLEALKLECSHFVDCIENGSTPVSDGKSGLDVVRMLEACDRSLSQQGRPVEIDFPGRSLYKISSGKEKTDDLPADLL
ncbi:MAG: Gfo/Idh/MocA family oxidoreductase [Fibrobacter sp.]|nr:Gfo/Idh/MocA family oxidoreductase [Fibrobacter sp.]